MSDRQIDSGEVVHQQVGRSEVPRTSVSPQNRQWRVPTRLRPGTQKDSGHGQERATRSPQNERILLPPDILIPLKPSRDSRHYRVPPVPTRGDAPSICARVSSSEVGGKSVHFGVDWNDVPEFPPAGGRHVPTARSRSGTKSSATRCPHPLSIGDGHSGHGSPVGGRHRRHTLWRYRIRPPRPRPRPGGRRLYRAP